MHHVDHAYQDNKEWQHTGSDEAGECHQDKKQDTADNEMPGFHGDSPVGWCDRNYFTR